MVSCLLAPIRCRCASRAPHTCHPSSCRGCACRMPLTLCILLLSAILFTGRMQTTFHAAVLVMMILQLSALVWLAPDSDYLRIRSVLAANYIGVAAAAYELGLTAAMPAPSPAQARRVENAFAQNITYQRSVPPIVMWPLQVVLLGAGFLIGGPFAEAWAPPGESIFQGFAVLMFAGGLLVLALLFDRSLNRQRLRAIANVSAATRSNPIGVLRRLPLHSPSFRRKLLDDLDSFGTLPVLKNNRRAPSWTSRRKQQERAGGQRTWRNFHFRSDYSLRAEFGYLQRRVGDGRRCWPRGAWRRTSLIEECARRTVRVPSGPWHCVTGRRCVHVHFMTSTR